MTIKKCITCKTSLTNNKGSTIFVCPGCNKETIIRCAKCRETVSKYVCPACGFEGPN